MFCTTTTTIFIVSLSASLTRAASLTHRALVPEGNAVSDHLQGHSPLFHRANLRLHSTHGSHHRSHRNSSFPAHTSNTTPTVPSQTSGSDAPRVKNEHLNKKRALRGFGYAFGLMKKQIEGRGVAGDGLDGVIAQLTLHKDDVVGNSQALQSYASQSKSDSFKPSKSFESGVTGRLTDLHASTGLFYATLHDLGAKKGLANYDRSNEFETQLKDVVNAVKYALNAVDCLIYEVPVLGPILGPIVYSLKCVIDDILNACENILDGLINATGLRAVTDILAPLVKTATRTTCSLININGLCAL